MKAWVTAVLGAAAGAALVLALQARRAGEAEPAAGTSQDQTPREVKPAPRRESPARAVAGEAAREPAHEAAGEPSGEPTREQLLQRDAASRQQIAALQARVNELEAVRRAPPAAGAREGADADLPPANKRRDFTAAELQAMAAHCEVRSDLPPLDGDHYKLRPSEAAQLHLSDEQAAKVSAAIDQQRGEIVARLRALYVDATGDRDGAQVLAPTTLGQEILHKSPPAQVEAARARVARERAGLEPAPEDPAAGTVPERYFRYLATVGDQVQRALEPAVGAQQAGVVRDHVDGWRMTMNGCHDGH